MKQFLNTILIVLAVIVGMPSAPVAAIATTPSTEPKTDGPFIITGYSFSGHSLRYVQIYNSSNEIASLDGWKISTEWSPGVWASDILAGLLPSHKKVIAADATVVSQPTFALSNVETPTDPKLLNIKLIPPTGSGFNDHSVTISVSGSTVNVATSPVTYYFSRNISGSTGNYLSTFVAFVPQSGFQIEQDALYDPLPDSPLQIVELYPDASSCAPDNPSALCTDYVKVFNASNTPVDLSALRIRTGSAGQSATTSNTAYPEGLLLSGAYAAVPLNLTDSGNWVWLEDVYGIARYDQTIVTYPTASGHTGWGYAYNEGNGAWQWTQYPTPYDQPNQFAVAGVVNQCKGLKLSEIGANYSPQFIEVYNSASSSLDISGCQLQTNRSQTANYKFSEGTKLGADGYLAISIADTNLSLTKTTTGTVYIVTSDGTSEVDARSYENLDADTSYALVGGTWLQTFTVTPSAGNKYSQYPACESGYERNIESGRCNKTQTESTLTPCLPTQYRSPETNRCRNLTTAGNTLTPCKPGQYRSLETNRCRSLTSASSTLKPCTPNQQRNPQTNRCRNIVKTVNADFPVQAIKDTGQATIGWWAFGGVGMMAAGYAGWEWRRETLLLIRKAAGIFTITR